MAYVDNNYFNKIAFPDATFTTSESPASIPILNWDIYAIPSTKGSYDVEAFTAEWGSISFDVYVETGIPTEITFWLGGPDVPSALTARKTVTLTSESSSVVAHFGEVSAALRIVPTGDKGVVLYAYVDAGSVSTAFAQLTYSPK